MTRRRTLTESQIIALRAEYKPGKRGYGYGALAAKHGVGASTIRDAIKRYTAYSARVK